MFIVSAGEPADIVVVVELVGFRWQAQLIAGKWEAELAPLQHSATKLAPLSVGV
jgi:hypothetical protein